MTAYSRGDTIVVKRIKHNVKLEEGTSAGGLRAVLESIPDHAVIDSILEEGYKVILIFEEETRVEPTS